MTTVALTRVSSNRKTGPIPVSTASSESCRPPALCVTLVATLLWDTLAFSGAR